MANFPIETSGPLASTNLATTFKAALGDQFATLLKAAQAAQSIRELIDAATKGDKHAMEFVFNQGGRLALTCFHLAGDATHTASIRPIVEKMAAVPVIYSGIKSSDEHARSVYDKFETSREKQPFKQGTWWANEFEASRSMAETLAIMAAVRIEARAKPKKERSKSERICGDLHSTRKKSPDQRKQVCKQWRDAFIKFVAAWHEEKMCPEITTWPEFKGHANRKGNRDGATPLAGIGEKLLEFICRHLDI